MSVPVTSIYTPCSSARCSTFFFYLWYAVEWLLRLAYCRDGYKSYANLAFEREAYANQYNPRYPQQRRPYAWLHHLWHRESWREVWH